MIPPRRPSDLPRPASSQSGTFASAIPELHLPGSSQQRSRLLGQEEQNVMLALGLVRAAASVLLSIEPKLSRARELLLRVEPPREAAATRVELGTLYDDVSRTVASAVFEGRLIFESATAVFDVDDARRNGEPLTVSLPDLQSVLRGANGLEQFLTRARVRGDVERMADALTAVSADGKAMLREAERHLSVLLTHFHRQRREHGNRGAQPADLAQAAARLRDRVQHAGTEALIAQGELSTRATSLVLSDRPPR
jgi:flagellin-like hook-associated protein FlgL